MPVDRRGEYELDTDGSIIRNVENVATTSKGHIQAYDRWNAAEGGTCGARLVGKSGAVEIRTDGHETKKDATNWILLALGFVAMGVAVVAVGLLGGLLL